MDGGRDGAMEPREILAGMRRLRPRQLAAKVCVCVCLATYDFFDDTSSSSSSGREMLLKEGAGIGSAFWLDERDSCLDYRPCENWQGMAMHESKPTQMDNKNKPKKVI